jgi:hypothetical protein
MSMVVGAIVAGVAVAGATIYSANVQADAAQNASETQADAAQAGIDAVTGATQAGQDTFAAQNAKLQELFQPYTQAGTQSLQAQQDLNGLNGPEAQQRAISAIQNGSEYQTMLAQGNTNILQNASATGGVRGGNTQGALGTFAPTLLNNLVNNQYQRLGGITGLGAQMAQGYGGLGNQNAAGVAGLGMQGAQAIAGLLGQQGQAVAGGQIAQGQQNAAIANGIISGVGAGTGLYGTGLGGAPAPGNVLPNGQVVPPMRRF